MTIRAVAALVLVAALAACSGDDEGAAPGPEEERFCELLADAPPAADPFESGIGPDEVERRLTDLRRQFDSLAAVAPDGLAGDLDELASALAELDEVLAAEDYDLAALAAANPDLSRFDDPRFAEIGARLAEHREDTCDP